jgi:hypothetical protein
VEVMNLNKRMPNETWLFWKNLARTAREAEDASFVNSVFAEKTRVSNSDTPAANNIFSDSYRVY